VLPPYRANSYIYPLPLVELFRGFADGLENRLQHGVAPLNVPPADAELGRLNGVGEQGELDPSRPGAKIYCAFVDLLGGLTPPG
jgi:hypothetical protein